MTRAVILSVILCHSERPLVVILSVSEESGTEPEHHSHVVTISAPG